MNIVVLVKYVPEPTAQWRFTADHTVDRAAVEGRLSELDEYAVEQAVRLVEAGQAGGITYVTVGPAKAAEGLRKALAMGGDAAVHVLDEALVGSDPVAISLVLARAAERIGFDMIICGMASTDAEMSVVPAMVADRLGLPQLTHASDLAVHGTAVTIHRDGERTTDELVADLPVLVSVTDQSGEPRYPAFKAIMTSRKKPMTTWSLADLDITPGEVGLAGAGTVIRSLSPRPPRDAGTVVVDDGDAASRLAEFLAAHSLV